ncbi:MAG: hypothetical protein SGI99_13195 [Pseudomonadota bacterium]|nr:hypothetical protein [Pseudomonadota bacterium]
MNIYSVTTTVHAAIGVAALATFWIAGFTRKGSPMHKRAGKIYLLAMVGVLVSAALIAAIATLRGPDPTDAFLGYLIVITATSCWQSWRAIRDKRDFQRYTGPVYRTLELLNPAAGIAIMAIGLSIDSVLLAGFSLIGIFIGIGMYRLRRSGPAHALWWRWEHISAMLGNGVATHIAFLAIGLPKLMPSLAGPTLQNLAWFGPLAVATALGIWLKRKYAPAQKKAMAFG